MMVEFDHTTGPHDGWNRYNFHLIGRPWSLLTIEGENEDPRSLLSPSDDDRNRPWPHYNIRSFKGVLTPEAAVEIVRMVHSAYEDGKGRGSADALYSVRKAIGL